VEKKTTKKAIKISSETVYELEKKETSVVGVPGTQWSHIGCCP